MTTQEETDQHMVRVREACQMFSISRSELYRRISAGDIEAIKIGRSTRIVKASVLRWINGLPRLNGNAA